MNLLYVFINKISKHLMLLLFLYQSSLNQQTHLECFQKWWDFSNENYTIFWLLKYLKYSDYYKIIRTIILNGFMILDNVHYSSLLAAIIIYSSVRLNGKYPFGGYIKCNLHNSGNINLFVPNKKWGFRSL